MECCVCHQFINSSLNSSLKPFLNIFYCSLAATKSARSTDRNKRGGAKGSTVQNLAEVEAAQWAKQQQQPEDGASDFDSLVAAAAGITINRLYVLLIGCRYLNRSF
jgi:hypothetical protein